MASNAAATNGGVRRNSGSSRSEYRKSWESNHKRVYLDVKIFSPWKEAKIVDASMLASCDTSTKVSDVFRISNVMRRTGCAAGGTAALINHRLVSVVSTSLQTSSCVKLDFNWLDAT